MHENLPDEISIMIFKMLDFKSLVTARKTCKKWMDLIDGFDLLNPAKFSKLISFCVYQSYLIFILLTSHLFQSRKLP